MADTGMLRTRIGHPWAKPQGPEKRTKQLSTRPQTASGIPATKHAIDKHPYDLAVMSR